MESLRKKMNGNGSKISPFLIFPGPTATFQLIQMSENDHDLISLICLILQDEAVSYESSDPCRGLVCITLYQPVLDSGMCAGRCTGKMKAPRAVWCWEIGLYLSVSQIPHWTVKLSSQDWTEEICHRAQT